MNELRRHSERFAASGGMGARTARRALGTPRVGFWDLFLRETLQNSWDARLSDRISYRVAAWHVNPPQRRLLRERIFADLPLRSRLPEVLAADNLALLCVADSGTRGLTGPTRADVAHVGRTDFVDFVRDTGRRADKGFAGGTYGFGKAVLPAASAAATMVIYTRTGRSGETSRLIAMAVDEEYRDHGLRYTGRHWWGDLKRDLAEPLEGTDADRIAATLGMYEAIDGTGTAIAVVAPRAPENSEGPSSLEGVIRRLARAAAEHAWPHMIPDHSGSPSITFQFSCNGTPHPVPDPYTDDRLRAFAEAYEQCLAMRAGALGEGDTWPWNRRWLASQRPKRRLGALAWRTYGRSAAQEDAPPAAEVALLREPRFVVSYRPVRPHPSGQCTAGVFLADEQLNDEFAAAEPPTHDEWVPTPGRYGDPVRVTLKRIDEEVRPQVSATVGAGAGVQPTGIVRVASFLGQLLDGNGRGGDPRIPSVTDPSGISSGTVPRPRGAGGFGAGGAGAATPSGDDGDPGARPNAPAGEETGTPVPVLRRPRVELDSAPRLVVLEGRQRSAEFPFTLRMPPTVKAAELTAKPDVLVDGGRETEPPAGAARPQILGWRNLATNRFHPSPTLIVKAAGVSRWTVAVSQPADTAVSVTIVADAHR